MYVQYCTSEYSRSTHSYTVTLPSWYLPLLSASISWHRHWIRDTYEETGDPARMPAQLAGRWGQRNWNNVGWGKICFVYWADWGCQGWTKISCTGMTSQERTNQERTCFIYTLWVPIHLNFNSQQGSPLSSLSGYETLGGLSLVAFVLLTNSIVSIVTS